MVNWAMSDLKQLFAESVAVIGATSLFEDEIVRMGTLIAQTAENGGKLMVCGNGGSAADADHLVAELMVRLKPHVNRDPIPAISLALGTAAVTAHANDYEYLGIFSRALMALGKPEDVLLAISTSGNSPNIVNVLDAARTKGIMTMALLGAGGGSALQFCDVAIVVPSNVTGRIQEAHGVCVHALAEVVEGEWLKK